MKRISLAVIFFLLTSAAFAQIEIGIKLTPSIATNRVVAPKEFGFKALNAKTHFGGGVIADYFFGENYAFSTGIIYNARGAGVSYTDQTTNQTRSDEFSIQYLEIPITIKLFTNEVAPDTRVYFQAGGSLNPRISAKVNNEKLDPSDGNNKFTTHFNLLDFSALISVGAEKQLGESTKVFAGLSYHRGLVDIDDFYEEQFDNENIEIRNSYVALDLGIKF